MKRLCQRSPTCASRRRPLARSPQPHPHGRPRSQPQPHSRHCPCPQVVNIQDGAGERLASRRFDAEHTLRDLVNWVRSLERSPNGSIKLINTTQGAIELDLERCLDRSLFSLDLWPVSQVRVVSVGAA